jgi:diacylglycerol kinase (ATP)
LKKRNFIIFINPISGTKDKEKARNSIEKKLTQHGHVFQFLPTEKSGNYSFLTTKIEEENITDVIICGGDGTISQVTSFLRTLKIQVGIIPMGSGNGLAFCAGIPKSPIKAIDVILHGKASYIDAFLVNKQFGCHNFGVGFDGKIAHDFASSKNRGAFNYIKLTAQNYFKAKAYPFQIKVNETILDVDAFFISVLNSNQFGNSLTIAPKASLKDGLLDVVVVKKSNKFDIFFKVLKQLKNGQVVNETDDKKTIHYFQTKKICISNINNALMHLDGEPIIGLQEIEIEIIEKAILLIQP